MKTFRHTLEQWQEPADLEGDERNIILALARIWYSVVTGDIVAKDEAASWLMPKLPVEHADTLQAACAEYLGWPKRTGLNPCRQYNGLYGMQKQITDLLE